VGYEPSRHGPRRVVGPGFHARVHALVRAVPRGFVTTYGDVARALGRAGVARQVGFALAALPDGSDVPWWRVVAAGGRLSTAPATRQRQRRLLLAEGVLVRGARTVDFQRLRFVCGAFDAGGTPVRSARRRP
jgi:methylated-DNA-protein-cysteine methyltransferase-like protein